MERVLRGIKRPQGTSKRERLRVTLAILIQMRKNSCIMTTAFFWAKCCVVFFAFLRSREFTPSSNFFDSTTHLALADITVNRRVDPSVIIFRVKFSNTDPCRKGYIIRLGKSRREVCAVKALLQYFHVRGERAGPLFCHRNGKPLTKTLTSWLRSAAVRVN